ncbi:hypothetical protein [Sandaracinus amylolyticus]|uniref:Uncharacterized protein n=1 Tax=Sandaracinus amylolyticus TaxID=927083 RepID=A0A0F6W0I2_9BACT|nr:hypothetical protein [Sandaracinus amylolyticus]AKF04311.1 hypothetical protein DB32_001460 [Sandaracinus amylolyticus]
MDAELVWKTWRRILREPELHESVLAGAIDGRAHGLSPEEARIAADYAAHSKMTRWAVETYRFRLERGALFALGTGAPLTLRLLESAGVDTREVARRYLRSVGYGDDGPHVYRSCAAFLDFLRRHPPSAPVRELVDTIALESTVVSLIRQLADAPESSWPARPSEGEPQPRRYVQSGTGRVVSTTHALASWLAQPELVAANTAAAEPEHFLVYVPSVDSDYDIAELSRTAKQLFDALASPRSFDEVRSSLPPDDDDEHDAALETFLSLGVVRAEMTS